MFIIIIMDNYIFESLRQYNENERRYHQNIQQMMDIIENYYSNRNHYTSRTHIPGTTRRSNTRDRDNRPNLTTWMNNYIPRREPIDVVVRPTSNQIERATELFNFGDNETSFDTCPITMEHFVDGEEVCRILSCRHIFKKNALMDWFTRNVRCPVCRYDIRNYQEPVNSNINIDEQTEQTEQTPETQTHRNTTTTPIMRTLQNTLESIFTENFRNIPFRIDENDELLYSLDIPLYFDLSANYLR